LWVYSTFASAMPRSGGDYVFVSRVLHPFLGWLLGWSQGMWLIFFWIGFNAWFALTFAVPVALSPIGAVTGQNSWIDLSNNLLASFPVLGITTQWWVLIIGTLINIGFAVLLILGGQSFWRWQKLFFLFAGGSIVLARAESTIEVVRCRSNQSTVLGIPPGTPMLQVEGKTYDVTDQFVEFSQVLYRADRFRFTIESFRRDDRVLHLIGAPDRKEGA